MADEWSPPAGVTPQQYRQEPSGGIEQLLNVIDRRKRELDEMRSSPLKTAGLSVEPDLLRVNGSLVVEGDLSVPNGAIRNDFLESPVVPVADDAEADSFTVPTTATDIVTVSIPIPAGYTKCVATGLGSLFAFNSTPNVDYVYARVYIDAPTGSWWGIRPLSMIGPNNGSADLSPVHSKVIEGLAGSGSITFRLSCQMDFAAIGSPFNLASIAGTCLFFR